MPVFPRYFFFFWLQGTIQDIILHSVIIFSHCTYMCDVLVLPCLSWPRHVWGVTSQVFCAMALIFSLNFSSWFKLGLRIWRKISQRWNALFIELYWGVCDSTTAGVNPDHLKWSASFLHGWATVFPLPCSRSRPHWKGRECKHHFLDVGWSENFETYVETSTVTDKYLGGDTWRLCKYPVCH